MSPLTLLRGCLPAKKEIRAHGLRRQQGGTDGWSGLADKASAAAGTRPRDSADSQHWRTAGGDADARVRVQAADLELSKVAGAAENTPQHEDALQSPNPAGLSPSSRILLAQVRVIGVRSAIAEWFRAAARSAVG